MSVDVFRLQPSAGALGRGFVRLWAFERDEKPQIVRLPVASDVALLAEAASASTPAIEAEEGAWERLGGLAAARARARRRFTSIGRAALRFGETIVFPEGSKAHTRPYRKQLQFASRAGLALDGRFVRQRPELFEGFAPCQATAPRAAPRVAVALHLHYIDLWPEIENLIGGWGAPLTLFVTLTAERPELADAIAARFPGARVRVVDNRGRDVRPFLLWLEDNAFDGYDLVCKIHGKRSLGGGRYPAFGDLMRRALFLDLIAADAQVQRIAAMFAADPDLGVVGPRRYRPVSTAAAPRDVLGPNRPTVEALARRIGLPVAGPEFDFFEGSMFWARPAALAPLAALRLSREFPAEAGRIEGALEHALERLFSHAARAAGFAVADVAVDDP